MKGLALAGFGTPVELDPFSETMYNISFEGVITRPSNTVGMRIYGGYVYGLHDGEECRNKQQRAINI